ncbi:hypothetical protein IM697_18105 [Streptomyces ferrugineus]|uniref:Uncharacterized protein n=1 Tax=Streptomyces ferrugineus TaxID=1413221 RepID=A0A7M2SXX7_9ACTN|nr:hypothetical protein [Streptomyces ferrugineus]QOV40141.1 hypothetical protein IM697_18105 [Streptomyces ferrugineus]
MHRNGRLFSSGTLRDYLHKNLQKITQAVDAWDPEKFLITTEADVIEELTNAFRIVVPTLDREGVGIEPLKQGYGVVERLGDSLRVAQNTVTLLVPYTGDRAIFALQPNPHMEPGPQGTVTDTEVRLAWTGQSTDHEFVRRALDERISEITKCLGWARANVNGYNAQIEQVIPQRVHARKQALLASRNLEASLGFPIRKRTDAKTYEVPLVRKKIKTESAESSTDPSFKPEHVLADADYEEALRVLKNARNQLERSPSLAGKLDEEEIRDVLLLALNSQFEGTAAGEVFNFKGKTDILIRVEDRHVFIGECKFWKGPKTITDTLNQLLGYLTWRDTKAAVLLFVREKAFSEIVSKALGKLEEHPNFKRRGSTNEFGTRHDFVFHVDGDPSREVKLAFLPFHLRQADSGS